MSNLEIYNEVRSVPKEAQKKIKGGRLSGMTDINPMWRIKQLTETFGPCGIGWKYEITDKRLEEGGNNEIAAFVDIDLYYKKDGEWSEAIPGTGGSTFVAKERKGLHTSDECFKMALTDAISIACKALGFGADIYWDKDTTKYSKKKTKSKKVTLKEMRKKDISKIKKQLGVDNDTILTEYQSIMKQRGIDDIEKPDEQEWETIVSQLKENLEG